MKKVSKFWSAFSAFALLVTLAAPVAANHHEGFSVPSGNYALEDTHGYIVFSYSHLGFSKPHLRFDRFNVSLDADASKPAESKLSVTVDAASINSQVEAFDDHLNGADFFETEKYPEIAFVSTGMKRLEGDVFEVQGELTIKGVTKPVTLEATINKAANHPMQKKPTIGVSAKGTLLRSEWGLGKYAPAVGDEVTLDIQVELIKAE